MIVTLPSLPSVSFSRNLGARIAQSPPRPTNLPQDLFFGAGESKPPKPLKAVPADLTLLKSGESVSLQKVMKISWALTSMLGHEVLTPRDEWILLGAHTVGHLYRSAMTPEHPDADLCEKSRRMAAEEGLLTQDGDVDPDVLAVVRSGVEMIEAPESELPAIFAQGPVRVIRTETAIKAFFLKDPLQVPMEERLALAQSLGGDTEKAMQALHAMVKNGDWGLDALRALQSMGIKDALLTKALDIFNGPEGLQTAANRKDSLLRVMGEQDKSKPKFTLFA